MRNNFYYGLTRQRHWFIEPQNVGQISRFDVGRLQRSGNDCGSGDNMDTHLPLSTGNDGRSNGGCSEYGGDFDGRHDLWQRRVCRLSYLPWPIRILQFQTTIQRRTRLI